MLIIGGEMKMRTRKATINLIANELEKHKKLDKTKLAELVIKTIEESLENYKWKRTNEPIEG